jgi:DHA1 family bicyclomycin/chloramphenicol resistance-like MFS transporter
VIGTWAFLRIPETLKPEHRRSLGAADLLEGAKAVVSDRQSLGYTLAQTALFAGLLAYISSIQQIVFDVFKRPELIGVVFGAVAARWRWRASPTASWDLVSTRFRAARQM